MKKQLLIGFLIFLGMLELAAQKEDYIWMLGSGNLFDPIYTTSIIDFNTYPPTMEIYFQDFDFNIAAAIVSTSDGQLQCYSNGVDIKNTQHEIIEEGDELLDYMFYPGGLTLPQATMILPIPEQAGKYFFFTTEYFRFQYQGISNGGAHPLYFSTIDMNANDGQGKVIERNLILNSDTLAGGQFTSTRHANGRDWWLLAPEFHTNRYYRYLLSPNGVSEEIPQIVGDTVIESLGQAAFSADGKWYGRYNWNENEVRLDLYDFDRCTGLLSKHQHFHYNKEVPGGIAFSPSSRYLYVSLWEEIWQYDLQASDIFASGILVAEYDGFLGDNQGLQYHNRFFMMQLAPDGRIYINIPNTNSQYLHVIQYPDRAGVDCEVRQHAIQLPAFNAFTLPNLPWYRLGPEDGSGCDSLGINNLPMAHFRFDPDPDDSLNVVFTDLSAYQPEQWQWDFGDGNGSSTDKDNVYRYTDNGKYEVCLEVTNAYGSDRTCQIVDLDQITSANEVFTKDFQLYPNPFSDRITIDWTPTTKNTELRIVDALGRPIYQSRYLLSQTVIETAQWAPGIYFYQLSENGVLLKTGKLLKSQP